MADFVQLLNATAVNAFIVIVVVVSHNEALIYFSLTTFTTLGYGDI